MIGWLRGRVEGAYERHLLRSIGDGPRHVAVIQDGNRRYARKRGDEPTDGHRRGAKTTERMLSWCEDVGVEELTLYAFSTENFDRPPAEREALFDLIEGKLREFADAEEVHDRHVRIRAIGETHELPDRVREAIRYAERRTRGYDEFTLNVALAYGGRAELLGAARAIAHEVADSTLDPADVDVTALDEQLRDRPTREVDLIIRTGGDERTSNFLPWHANGNEAAAAFCAPYWPEFSKADFLRAIRTYEHREESWRRTRARRAIALLRAFGDAELDEARRTVRRFRGYLPRKELPSGGFDSSEPEREETVAD